MEQLTSMRGSQIDVLENLIKKCSPHFMKVGGYTQMNKAFYRRSGNKTSDEQINRVNALLDKGWPVKQIAPEVGVSTQTVRNIKRKMLTPSE